MCTFVFRFFYFVDFNYIVIDCTIKMRSTFFCCCVQQTNRHKNEKPQPNSYMSNSFYLESIFVYGNIETRNKINDDDDRK